MFYTFPPGLLKGCSATEARALNYLLGLCSFHGKHSKSGAQYWNASQRQMAEKLGLSRTWLSTCIHRLHKKFLITKIHRRREHGQWKTNLYKMGPEIIKIFKGTAAGARALINHVSNSRHIVIKTVSSKQIRNLEGGLRPPLKASDADDLAYLARLRTKFVEDPV